MVVPGAHSTDSGWSGGFCWLAGGAETGFAGSCGDAAVERTAKKTDRIAVLMNVPLRHARLANAVCISISGPQRQRLLALIIVYSIRCPDYAGSRTAIHMK